MQPIRTAASMHLSFEIHSPFGISACDRHREKILELYKLGINQQAIADTLGTTRRVVGYALSKYTNEGIPNKQALIRTGSCDGPLSAGPKES